MALAGNAKDGQGPGVRSQADRDKGGEPGGGDGGGGAGAALQRCAAAWCGRWRGPLVRRPYSLRGGGRRGAALAGEVEVRQIH